MRALKIIWRVISLLIVFALAFVLLFNVYTAAVRITKNEPMPRFLGFSGAVIISGSMEPAININDYILTLRQKSYSEGDIIAYRQGHSAVTHRIVEVGENGYITKGDANNTTDREPVLKENIVGKVVLVIPKMGKALEYMQTPLGMTLVVFTGLLLIFISPAKKPKKETKH